MVYVAARTRRRMWHPSLHRHSNYLTTPIGTGAEVAEFAVRVALGAYELTSEQKTRLL